MTAAHEPIAILGMGCRYPGGAVSPDDLGIEEHPREK